MARSEPLETVLQTAIDNADDDAVSIGELLDLYGHRSFGPIFTLLGLLVVIPPIGAIPGLPAAIGVVVLLFSVQMLFGASHIWVPGLVENLSISCAKLKKAQKLSAPALQRIDRIITDRLTWATDGAARYAAAVLVTLLALVLIPLELVPFAVAMPGVAITAVGVALLAHDGALMLAAFGLSAAAVFVLIFYSPLGAWLGL